MKRKLLQLVGATLVIVLVGVFVYRFYTARKQKEQDEHLLSIGLAFAIGIERTDLMSSKELTRAVAAAYLNDYYLENTATVGLNKLYLKQDQVQKAINDGIIQQSSRFPNSWVLGPIASRLTEHIPMINELTANLFGKPIAVRLKEPQPTHVMTIDGITSDSFGGGIKVDYTARIWSIHIPDETMDLFAEYFYITVRRTAIFRFYDDGWRIVQAKAQNE